MQRNFFKNLFRHIHIISMWRQPKNKFFEIFRLYFSNKQISLQNYIWIIVKKISHICVHYMCAWLCFISWSLLEHCWESWWGIEKIGSNFKANRKYWWNWFQICPGLQILFFAQRKILIFIFLVFAKKNYLYPGFLSILCEN